MECNLDSVLQVVEAGIAPEDAEKLLAKAFGCRGQVCSLPPPYGAGDLIDWNVS